MATEYPFKMKLSFACRLVEILDELAHARFVADLRVGQKAVGVELDDGICGLAYRFQRNAGREDVCSLEPRALRGKNAAELLSWLTLDDMLHRSVGLAVANAVALQRVQEPMDPQGVVGRAGLICSDVVAAVDWQVEDRAAMIGYFAPMVERVRERCALDIYELDVSLAPGLLESSEAPAGLKRSDIALISSTTIVNNTIDGLLEAAVDCREVAMLGPSTPLVPEAFAGTPVTLLSGVMMVTKDVLEMVDNGGSMRQFLPFIKKVNLRLN